MSRLDLRPPDWNHGVQSVEEFIEHRRLMRRHFKRFTAYSKKRAERTRQRTQEVERTQIANYATSELSITIAPIDGTRGIL